VKVKSKMKKDILKLGAMQPNASLPYDMWPISKFDWSLSLT